MTQIRSRSELCLLICVSVSSVVIFDHDQRTRPDLRLRLAVRAAHRPAGARAERLLPDRPPRPRRPSACKELNPKGIILSGGPASVYEPGAPHCDPKLFDLGVPVLGICYGMQLACQCLGGKVGGRRTPASTAGPTLTVTDPNGLFRGYPAESTVWMSHGDQVQTVERRLRPAGRDRHLPARRGEAPDAAGLRPPVPPGGQPHAARRADPARTSSATSAAAPACGRCRRSSTRRSPSMRGAGRQEARHLRPVGRRRFVRVRGAAAQGDRPAGRVHLRRQRPAAGGRGRGRAAHVPRLVQGRPARRRRAGAVPGGARGRHRPAGEAAIIGHVFIDVFKHEAKSHPGREVPGAGDALPRRDRERRRGGRPGGDDQAAPQRRRAAGGTRASS